MALTERNLGGRIALIEPGAMNESQANLYQSFVKEAIPWARSSGFVAALPDGKVIGPFNVALLSPEIGGAFAKLQSVEENRTTLSPRIRQIVILTIGGIWKSDYERYAHKAVARRVGLAERAIDALAEGEEPRELEDDERLAWQITKHIFVEHRLPRDLFERAQAAFGDQGIVDLLFLAGCYVTVCSLLNSFEVPAPDLGIHS